MVELRLCCQRILQLLVEYDRQVLSLLVKHLQWPIDLWFLATEIAIPSWEHPSETAEEPEDDSEDMGITAAEFIELYGDDYGD